MKRPLSITVIALLSMTVLLLGSCSKEQELSTPADLKFVVCAIPGQFQFIDASYNLTVNSMNKTIRISDMTEAKDNSAFVNSQVYNDARMTLYYYWDDWEKCQVTVYYYDLGSFTECKAIANCTLSMVPQEQRPADDKFLFMNEYGFFDPELHGLSIISGAGISGAENTDKSISTSISSMNSFSNTARYIFEK